MSEITSVKVRAVFFDFAGVIGHFDTEKHRDFFRRHTTASTAEAQEFFSNIYHPELVAFESGDLTISEYFTFVKQKLGLNASLNDFLSMASGLIRLDPYMYSLVRQLKAEGIATALISNINPIHEDSVRTKFPGFIELFDVVMMSHHLGYRKPDPRMWLRPMAELGLTPGQCFYVDDLEVNCAAFEALGGLTYLYDVTDNLYILEPKKVTMHRVGLMTRLQELGIFDS